jgi:3-oxoacyl-[acyl-carrier-protein] synthase III
MVNQRPAYIVGIGSFSPGAPIPFDEIENVLGKITNAPPRLMKRIDRMRSFMMEMLGIEYSHYAIDPKTREITENNVSMSEKAARKALTQAKVAPQDIDLIIYAGILYDYLCPPTSVMVQEALQIPYCAEMSIHSNCTAIYKAIQIAADLISNGRYNKALVVTSQISSVFLKAEYFNQKVLTLEQVILRWFLSDGAGALVMSHEKGSDLTLQVTDTYLESVGLGIEPSMKMGVGVANSNLLEIYEHGYHHLVQDISKVGDLAPKLFKRGFDTMMEKTGLNLREVKCFFANIPTKHLMDELTKRLRKDHDYPDLPFYTKLVTRGYQGAPTVIIALDDYLEETQMSPGDRWVSFVTESSKWMHAGFILDYF